MAAVMEVMAVRDITTATRIIRLTDTHRMPGAIEAITRILTTIILGKNITTSVAITTISIMPRLAMGAALSTAAEASMVEEEADMGVDTAAATVERSR